MLVLIPFPQNTFLEDKLPELADILSGFLGPKSYAKIDE